MALEEQMAALAANVAALTTVTEKLISLRADAIETVKSTAAPAAKATTATKAADAAKTTETATTSAYDGLREIVAEYVAGGTREEERAARKLKVRNLLAHEKIKKPEVAADAAPDTTNIMESAIGLFKDQMKLLKEKGDITEPPKAASDALDI